MKVLISDSISADGVKKLEQEGFEVVVKTGLKPDELQKFIVDFDAIIVRSATKVTKEIIDAGKNLKVIGRAGVGLDNVDVNTAKEKGIVVVNTPSATSISVSELALGFMFAVSRQLVQTTLTMREGKWDKKAFEGCELFGKTLGIIGCGRIGRELAQRAYALGMKVIGSDLAGYCDYEKAVVAHIEVVPMDELLKNSDYISLHVPLTPQTKHMLGDREFSIMKPNAILINCARGGVVDEGALYSALKEGKLAYAAMDVFENEPCGENPLLTLPNFICAPHIGASTKEGQTRAGVQIAEVVSENLKALEKV